MRYLTLAGTTLTGLAVAAALASTATAEPAPAPTPAQSHPAAPGGAEADHRDPVAGGTAAGPGALAYTAAGLALVVGGAAFVTIAWLRRTAHVAAHASR